MGDKLVQRAVVSALVLFAVGGAVAAYLVSNDRLHARQTARLDGASDRTSNALRRRAFLLQDLADMIGVHDDADVSEFTRYAHVRGVDEARDGYAFVGIQWVRRSPKGELAPAGDVPPGTKLAEPVIFKPTLRGEASRADAVAQPAAGRAIRLASRRKRAAISKPTKLAGGHAGLYLAVPVEARRYSGDVSRLESRSAIVGLIDAQALVSQSLTRAHQPAMRLADGATTLAAVGASPRHAVQTELKAYGQRWSLTVDGGSKSAIALALPWLILVAGLALAAAVARILSESNNRKEEAMRLARERAEQLDETHREAVRRSREDPLTEIFNRRHFGEVLARELSRARRGDPPPAVLLLDLDRFKAINDAHGHLIGDAVIRATARRLQTVLRGTDTLARWGGEEFVVLAPGIDRDGASALAERARRVVAEDPVELDDLSIGLTASVGVAVAGGTESPDSLVAAADVALYAAKRAGRNCVLVSETKASVSS
jgi:diguanylate cyclase (GGDEF)-like protein